MLTARHLYFSKVLAARKKNLTTARARKNKHTARILANARKDYSIPLSIPNSDQHQISPRNIYAYSTPEVMRIKDMITHWNIFDILITSPKYFYKKSVGTRWENSFFYISG